MRALRYCVQVGAASWPHSNIEMTNNKLYHLRSTGAVLAPRDRRWARALATRANEGPLAATWDPPGFRWSDPENTGEYPDNAYFSMFYWIWSDRAVRALSSSLSDHGEFFALPSDVEGGPSGYNLFNCTRVLAPGALSTASEFRVGPMGDPTGIRRAVVVAQEPPPAFRLAEYEWLGPFFTEAFRLNVERNGLTGFEFRDVGTVGPQ